MASPIHLALVKAEYAYAAQTEDELSLEEDSLYYLLEDDDPEWHKVKLKTEPTSAEPSKIGLVPANYILPAPVIHLVTALYAYDAQTDDELTIREDESLELYEEDGDWSLVGRNLQDGSRGVGFVPTTYIEAAAAPDAPASRTSETPPQPSIELPTTISSQPSNVGLTNAVDVITWSVTDIDHKKKKRKGTLGIGNGTLIFASESDKMGVQQYPINNVSITKTEKGKHLILQCGSDERHFQVAAKDLDDIVSKIQRTTLEAQPLPSNSPSPSQLKSPVSPIAPALRPPSALANPDRPSGSHGRKVSFVEPSGKPATALYHFDAQGDDELSVGEGERLIVLDDTTDDDWWKCAKESNGQEGVVPASYIELDEGQPSGNPQAADAAMTAAAADVARKQRIQEEEDARLAQQLADEDSSEARIAEAKAADRKLIAAREAEKRKMVEAEAAARRKRDSEARSTLRREAERALSNPGFMTGPTPPKLAARPDSAQGGSQLVGGGPTPPRRPDSAPREGKSKPQGFIRTWRDRTGQFKVEAEFRGLQNGKIRLHKLNGVIIEVPLSKMSAEDVIWLEGATGRTLRSEDPDEIPLAKLSVSSISNDPRGRSTGADNHKRPTGPPKKPIDWFEFFLNAGCDLDDCTRYANNFEKDRIDENLLADLETSTMRNLGLREGDVIRVRKHIKQKYTSPDDAASDQMRKDEELAKKLQDQDLAAAPNIFTNGPNGSLKTTRRGRPTPTKAGSSLVDVASLSSAKDLLSDAPQLAVTPPVTATSSSATLISVTAPAESGFDDEAWQVRPNSTTPVSPTVQTSTSRPPSASVQPSAADAAVAASTPSKTSQPSLTDEIFQKIMNHGKQSEAARAASAPVPAAIPTNVMAQPTTFDPNGPRGPLAPVASNAPLLNPLVPLNSGMKGFVPTRPVQPQATGFIGQKMPMMQQNTMLSSAPAGNVFASSALAMQPTGMGMGMIHMGERGMQPTGMGMMQSQPTGLMQSQPTGMMQSHPIGMMQSQPTGMMQSQPTGMMQSQPTGMGQMGMMQSQMTGFNPGFSAMPPPPVPNIPSMYASSASPAPPSAPAKSFNPSDIFSQMKTGQFTQNANNGPQDPSKYNALRPQSTGFVGGGIGGSSNAFAQQFMPGQQQAQAGMQPLQPQPTGFAPGGYVMSQQTGMPTQNMYPNQTQQQQQWRGY